MVRWVGGSVRWVTRVWKRMIDGGWVAVEGRLMASDLRMANRLRMPLLVVVGIMSGLGRSWYVWVAGIKRPVINWCSSVSPTKDLLVNGGRFTG